MALQKVEHLDASKVVSSDVLLVALTACRLAVVLGDVWVVAKVENSVDDLVETMAALLDDLKVANLVCLSVDSLVFALVILLA